MSSTDPLPQTLCPRLFAPCIFSKLGVENRAQAIVLARDSGFGVQTALSDEGTSVSIDAKTNDRALLRSSAPVLQFA